MEAISADMKKLSNMKASGTSTSTDLQGYNDMITQHYNRPEVSQSQSQHPPHDRSVGLSSRPSALSVSNTFSAELHPRHESSHESYDETVSAEIDRRTCKNLNRTIKDSLTVKRDRIIVNSVTKEIKIINE